MPHVFTVTLKPIGSNDYELLIEETGVGSASEVTINDPKLPRKFRLLRQVTALVSGSATTVSPILTRTEGGTGREVLVQDGEPKEIVDNVAPAPVPCYLAGDSLFHRSNPDAGSDNEIESSYLIRSGWVD